MEVGKTDRKDLFACNEGATRGYEKLKKGKELESYH